VVLHSGLTLAYLGDSLWETYIREYLMKKGFTKVNDLHRMAIKYTAATPQAKAAEYLQKHVLTEVELSVFKRGRNAVSSRKPKNSDLGTYHQSTGHEALIGYLYLNKELDRLNEIIVKSIAIIEELQEE
jgi:ribonuclease-3 family protein